MSSCQITQQTEIKISFNDDIKWTFKCLFLSHCNIFLIKAEHLSQIIWEENLILSNGGFCWLVKTKHKVRCIHFPAVTHVLWTLIFGLWISAHASSHCVSIFSSSHWNQSSLPLAVTRSTYQTDPPHCIHYGGIIPVSTKWKFDHLEVCLLRTCVNYPKNTMAL